MGRVEADVVEGMLGVGDGGHQDRSAERSDRRAGSGALRAMGVRSGHTGVLGRGWPSAECEVEATVGSI